MTSKDFAIVIQGPLISSGNSGDGIHVNEFSCIENIQNLILSSKHLVKGYVVSTWKSSIPIEVEDDVILLNLDDPGPKPVIGYPYPSNEYRQSFGCLSAINKAIEEFNPKYILKIRTDQFVDLPFMIDHMINVDKQTSIYQRIGQSGFLYFPNMLSWSPYSVGDFFIGGHARDIQAFFEAQIELSNHTFGYDFSWLHSDIILRHAFRNLQSKLKLQHEFFVPNLAPSLRLHLLHHKYPIKFHSAIIRLWSLVLEHSVSFFPRSISENMIWRGSKMNFEKHTMGEFYEEWQAAYPNFQTWISKMYPGLYLKKNEITILDKFLHFYPEKLVEIREKRQVFRRHVFRLLRIILSTVRGHFPKDLIVPISSLKRFFLR